MVKSLDEPSSIYPDFSMKQLDLHIRCHSIAGLLPTWVKRLALVEYNTYPQNIIHLMHGPGGKS